MTDDSRNTTLSIAGHSVTITHPDKPYFSKQAKLSKLDIVQYYLSVADGALLGIRGRPLVLKRFVNGAEAAPFYQKRAPTKRPEWLTEPAQRNRPALKNACVTRWKTPAS